MPDLNSKPLSYMKTGYHPENAYWMARFSELSYRRRSDGSPDTASVLEALQAQDPGFEQVHGFDCNSSQAILVKHEKYVVAAFRGTDELADWFDNINALPTDGPFARVHAGFQGAMMDVWPSMRTVIREYRKRKSDRTRVTLPLWIAGHSLGGAMATLAAAQLIQADEPFFGAYTFGQPRCGDREFARIFNSEAGSRFFRFQNNNDIVTRVPARLMGYSHVGSFVYISKDGALSRDAGWWFRFLDQVTGAVEDIGDIGIDAVEDHDIAEYLAAIETWGDRLPEA